MNKDVIKLKFWCNEHGFVVCGFDTQITAVFFNQRNELGIACPMCFKSRPMKLLRYTGLHDREQNEIYEGDVFKDQSGTWQVKMGVAMFVAVPIKAFNRWGQTASSKPLSYVNMSAQILGNIYENQELMS